MIGSQSILGSYDEDELPAEATASIEADIAFLDDPDRGKADQVEGIIWSGGTSSPQPPRNLTSWSRTTSPCRSWQQAARRTRRSSMHSS